MGINHSSASPNWLISCAYILPKKESNDSNHNGRGTKHTRKSIKAADPTDNTLSVGSLYLVSQGGFGTVNKSEILQLHTTTPCNPILFPENQPWRSSHCRSYWRLRLCPRVPGYPLSMLSMRKEVFSSVRFGTLEGFPMWIINPIARLPFRQQIENYQDSLCYPMAKILRIIPLLEL